MANLEHKGKKNQDLHVAGLAADLGCVEGPGTGWNPDGRLEEKSWLMMM